MGDHASIYTSDEFNLYVLKQLMVPMVRTSACYPQGNKWNASSHKSLEHIIKTMPKEGELSHEKIVKKAVWIYNATLHSVLGDTLFFTVIELDSRLLGFAYITAPFPTYDSLRESYPKERWAEFQDDEIFRNSKEVSEER